MGVHRPDIRQLCARHASRQCSIFKSAPPRYSFRTPPADRKISLTMPAVEFSIGRTAKSRSPLRWRPWHPGTYPHGCCRYAPRNSAPWPPGNKRLPRPEIPPAPFRYTARPRQKRAVFRLSFFCQQLILQLSAHGHDLLEQFPDSLSGEVAVRHRPGFGQLLLFPDPVVYFFPGLDLIFRHLSADVHPLLIQPYDLLVDGIDPPPAGSFKSITSLSSCQSLLYRLAARSAQASRYFYYGYHKMYKKKEVMSILIP